MPSVLAPLVPLCTVVPAVVKVGRRRRDPESKRKTSRHLRDSGTILHVPEDAFSCGHGGRLGRGHFPRWGQGSKVDVTGRSRWGVSTPVSPQYDPRRPVGCL